MIHGDGPCSTWAAQACPGDVIQVAGPRRGYRYPPGIAHLLIGGDETALPAIATILAALPDGVTATVFVEIPEQADIQSLASSAKVSVTWLPRDGAPTRERSLLVTAMTSKNVLQPECGVWVAAEAASAHALRRHFHAAGVEVSVAGVNCTGSAVEFCTLGHRGAFLEDRGATHVREGATSVVTPLSGARHREG